MFLDIGLIARKNQPTYAEAQMCHEQKKWLRFDATRSLAWDSWLYTIATHQVVYPKAKNHLAGQIIVTSHDLTTNGGLVREIPLFQGNLGW